MESLLLYILGILVTLAGEEKEGGGDESGERGRDREMSSYLKGLLIVRPGNHSEFATLPLRANRLSPPLIRPGFPVTADGR